MTDSHVTNRLAYLAVLAWRLLLRDISSGRLLIMFFATAIAVASTVSVSLLVARVEQVLIAESSALLAADLAIVTNDLPPPDYENDARALGLTTARSASMRSVVAYDDQLQLVSLKAVDANYPLRGQLEIAATPFGISSKLNTGPEPGEVWADPKLFQLLDIDVGDIVTIGRAPLRLGKVLVLEPDRGRDFFSLAPRLLMHYDDLAATELIVAGSRVRYTTLIAGPADIVTRYRDALDLQTGHTALDPRGARPEMRSAFSQAERFLSLAALSGVLLATIGIALAAASYSEHHEQTTVIVKTLGLTRGEIVSLFSFELLYLALLSTCLGDALAFFAHGFMVAEFLPKAAISGVGLPLTPLLHGGVIAVLALIGFGLPTLMRLSRIPVITILARDRVALTRPTLSSGAAMAASILLITPWHVGNPKLIALTLGGMVISAVGLAGAAHAMVWFMGRLRARTSISWRFGLANIARRARLSVLQSTAVGLGLAIILLLGLVRNDLVEQWSERLPPDAPNHFLINVQDDEVESMTAFLRASGLRVERFYPMVRGRLTAINDRAVHPEDYAEPRARRLADREFNLSWAENMKPDNRLVAGRWWRSAVSNGELSVEEGIAKRLGIALDDELTFTVAGIPIRGSVTSLRQVDWDNFEVNFFVVTTPDLLRGTPVTFITSFRLPQDQQLIMPELVARYPSVTVFDVDALMRQVRHVMDRVSSALMWVFIFSVCAGLLVLAAAVQTSQRERVLDTVLLKTLGASQRFIRQTMLLEFALLGLLGGFIASVGAVGTGWILAQTVLDIPYHPGWRIVGFGILGGVGSLTLIGITVVEKVLRQPVMSGLRESL